MTDLLLKSRDRLDDHSDNAAHRSKEPSEDVWSLQDGVSSSFGSSYGQTVRTKSNPNNAPNRLLLMKKLMNGRMMTMKEIMRSKDILRKIVTIWMMEMEMKMAMVEMAMKMAMAGINMMKMMNL